MFLREQQTHARDGILGSLTLSACVICSGISTDLPSCSEYVLTLSTGLSVFINSGLKEKISPYQLDHSLQSSHCLQVVMTVDAEEK